MNIFHHLFQPSSLIHPLPLPQHFILFRYFFLIESCDSVQNNSNCVGVYFGSDVTSPCEHLKLPFFLAGTDFRTSATHGRNDHSSSSLRVEASLTFAPSSTVNTCRHKNTNIYTSTDGTFPHWDNPQSTGPTKRTQVRVCLCWQ